MADRPLRVLYVHHAEMAGGAANSLLVLLRHLPPEQVDAVLVSPSDGYMQQAGAAGPARHRHIDRTQVRWSPNPLKLMQQRAQLLRLTVVLRKLHEAEHFDLVHANCWPAALAALAMGRDAPPVICHVRDTHTRAVVTRWLRSGCAAYIAIAHNVREFLLRNGYRDDLVHLIYNGIDADEFRPMRGRDEVRQEFGLGADTPLICCVARTAPWKRHELLLETALLLRKQRTDVRVLLVGGYGERDVERLGQLQELAGMSGLDDTVIFTGHRDDVPDLLAASDVFLHAASTEPMGRVVLEAMVLGKPIVVPDAAGPGELIEDSVSGLAVEPEDAPALAHATLKMLAEPEFARDCGRRARERVLTQFSATGMAQKTLALYRSVLARAGP